MSSLEILERHSTELIPCISSEFIFLTFFVSGGYFGLGWFRDFFRIPAYVREANDDADYLRNLSEKMRNQKKPPFSVNRYFLRFEIGAELVLFQFSRVFGQLIVGNIFGQLAMMFLPDPEDIGGYDLLLLSDLLAPLASAIGK